MAFVHASCVRFEEKGILILGPSGSGKSDLALRLIDAGAILISDDYVDLKWDGKILFGFAAPNIEGLIEIRGIGPVKTNYQNSSPIDLVLELTPRERIERLPEEEFFNYEDGRVPLYKFDCFSVSAIAKIKILLNR